MPQRSDGVRQPAGERRRRVDYDKEKLRIEKASTLNAIEQGEHSRTMLNRKMDIDERLVKQKDKPNGSAEKGLRSNNLKK